MDTIQWLILWRKNEPVNQRDSYNPLKEVRNCNDIVVCIDNGVNTDLKESVIKHVVELDERIKKIENIVDELEENHQAKMMEQQKNFDQELKDQAKVSERQMQLFRESTKHLKCLSLCSKCCCLQE